MMLRWIMAVAVATEFLGGVKKAEASFLTGSDLLEACESDVASHSNVCSGHLAAVIDTADFFVVSGFVDKHFCIPINMETSQLQRVVIKGLNGKPGELHMVTSGLVYNPLVSFSSCS